VSGEAVMGVVKRSNFEISFCRSISHDKEITCIAWLNDHIFATAGLDKVIKVWDAKSMN